LQQKRGNFIILPVRGTRYSLASKHVVMTTSLPHLKG